MPQHHGEVPMSGAVVARKVDPAVIKEAERRLASLEGRVWAMARYEDNKVRVRLHVSIPYDDLNDRSASHGMELTAEDGSPFEEAFQALIEANMPKLLREGRRAAALCLVSAEAAGEMEVK